ncbi:hypothetical protein KEM54_006469 [Ascosphaera aggregata]|nr:hypothetical protein KEM54_006469 [Ascosphaera aggregata]
MPSAALADPGFALQVAEMRRDRRVNSATKQASRPSFQKAPGLTPPTAEPSPRYIAISAASQIVTSSQPGMLDNFLSGLGGALVTPSSLALLNGFLDYLLWVVLMRAQSSSLSRVRSAVQSALEETAAQKVIVIADEELNEYSGGDDTSPLIKTEEDAEAMNDDLARQWDIQQTWKKIRLRCMVYARLGDLEEEDEREYLEAQGLAAPQVVTDPNDPSCISPATTIFLTSIIEFIGEHSLTAGGRAASTRIDAQRAAKARAEEEDSLADSGPQVKSPSAPERLTVLDEDIEQLASDSMVGELWRTWKRALRGSLSLMATLLPHPGRPRPEYRPPKLCEESFKSSMDECPIQGKLEMETQICQLDRVDTMTSLQVRHNRSQTLQERMTADSQEETDGAMNRIIQHYRSQSMTSPGAKRRAMVLSTNSFDTWRTGSADTEPVYVPSALDTVDIDKSLESKSCSDKCNLSSPDLSYYVEASARAKTDKDEVNDEAMITTCFIVQENQEREDKRHTLPWLVSPEHQEGVKCSAPDCTSLKAKPPNSAISTAQSLHRVNSRSDSLSGKNLSSIASSLSVSKRSLKGESCSSPVPSMFKYLMPRIHTSEGNDKGRLNSPSTTTTSLDDLLIQDGTIRKTYKSGRMRDMECRCAAELSKVPASAAREPTPRSEISTKYLSEFIRSTGPEGVRHPANTSNGHKPNHSQRKPQYQARNAVYDSTEDLYELAEFIRQGPPAPMTETNRLSPAEEHESQVSVVGSCEMDPSSSAPESQVCPDARRESESSDHTPSLCAPDRHLQSSFVEAGVGGSITLCDFLRTMPAPEEAQCTSSSLPTPLTLQSYDSSRPSPVRRLSTIQDRSICKNLRMVSMTRSIASMGQRSIFSSPSAASKDHLSPNRDAPIKKTKRLLRRQKKAMVDPYWDSPYGERDTPYGAELERERRNRKTRNLSQTESDMYLPPTAPGLPDGWSSYAGLAGRGYSVSVVANSSKGSMRSESNGGNPSSIKFTLSSVDDAINKAKAKVSGGRANDAFPASGSKGQPRTITKLFKRAR